VTRSCLPVNKSDSNFQDGSAGGSTGDAIMTPNTLVYDLDDG
jgi:hypothetical protein